MQNVEFRMQNCDCGRVIAKFKPLYMELADVKI